MKKTVFVISAALGVSGMLMMEKEVNVENEQGYLYIGVEEKNRNTRCNRWAFGCRVTWKTRSCRKK